jgi:hypothetical protein
MAWIPPAFNDFFLPGSVMDYGQDDIFGESWPDPGLNDYMLTAFFFK